MTFVLHLTSWLPTGPNDPTGVFVREHIEAARLHTSGAIIHVRWQDLEVRRGIQICRTDERPFPTVRLSLSRGPMRPIFLVVGLVRAWRLLSDGTRRPDVIHSHTLRTSVIAVALGRVARRPVVVTEHASALLPGADVLSRAEVLMARITYTWAHRVLPVSPTLANAIERLAPRAKISIVPNTVDTALFRYDEHSSVRNRSKVLVVGRLTPPKRIDLAIRAFALLRERRPQATLTIVGDGPVRSELAALASNRRLDDCVTFVGAVSKARVAEEMQDASVLLITSEVETFSVVAAEALSVGTAVVTTRCGGPEHFINRDSGVVVDGSTEGAVAGALLRALEQNWDRRKISDAARRRFGLSAVGRELAAIYQDVSRG